MAAFHDELLAAAEQLLRRDGGRRGRLPDARVRRSISTAYYALFHFLLDAAAQTIVGTYHPRQTRRRIFMRLFTHTGMLTTLNKIKGRRIDQGVSAFLHLQGDAVPFAAPPFARDVAAAFADAQTKRQDADYDRMSEFLAADAEALVARVRSAITAWQAARSAADRDFKQALLLLMLQKGTLRKDA